jgi:hypothetical protein
MKRKLETPIITNFQRKQGIIPDFRKEMLQEVSPSVKRMRYKDHSTTKIE